MTVRQILTGLGTQAAIFTIIGAVIWTLSGREWSTFVTFDWTQLGQGLALALALILLALVLFVGFPKYSEYLVRAQADNFAFLEKQLSFPAIIFISICAGVWEEAFFRGGLQTLAGDYMPVPVAITITSILFALVHFAKPVIAALIFVIGCVFGFAYWFTGSLLAVMIGHALYDVFALWYLQRELHRLDAFEPAEDTLDEEIAAS